MSNAKSELSKEIEGQKDFFILYLDDEIDLLDSVGVLAQDLGLKSFLTTDPNQALTWITEHRVDLGLIISDLRMPQMDGFEFRKKVAEVAPEIPFAILSAHVDTEIALLGIENKICAFIPKPISIEKIQEFILKDILLRIRTIKDDRELRAGFVSETENLLSDGEELLMALEQDTQNTEALNRFFGIVHTLKGASSFFEPKHLSRFAHRYEDLLKKLQRLEIPFNDDIVKTLFSGYDVIKELFAEFQVGKHPPRNFEALLETLTPVKSEGALPTSAKTPSATNEASPSKSALAPAITQKKTNEDVKVSVTLLNEFMALSGEVTVIRNMLNKCVRSIERQYAGDRDVATLADLLEELHKINGGVQAKITEIRKLPIKTILKSLQRAVRDISKQLGKDIEFKITGEELRVDAAIAEVLNNCLLHIVKNSIDHGLEMPEQRKSTGKPQKGQVELRCFVKDDKVIIEIADDGKGINIEAIKARLLKNASHTPEQIARMSNPELYAMIFAAGFSTATQVTDISGRGVGMSMVKDSVDALGGDIQIESTTGKGALFRLLLPVPKSVLIASCLSVVADAMQVGLLQDDLLRVIQLDETQCNQNIRNLGGAPMLLCDDELIPLIYLGDLLRGQKNASETVNRPAFSMRWIAVLKSPQDGRRVALEVDKILDVEDTVIKSIHPTLNSNQLYRGITFLEDGTLGLILSTHGILDFIGVTLNQENKERPTTNKPLDSRENDQTAITFKIPTQGTYAFPLSDIHRIEEVKFETLRQSGHTNVIPYRGGILEIVNLGKVFSPLQKSPSSVFPVLVVKNGDTLLGLQVDEVQDMIPIDALNSDLKDPRHAIQGHFFYESSTITLLSLDRAIELCRRDAPTSNDEFEQNPTHLAA